MSRSVQARSAFWTVLVGEAFAFLGEEPPDRVFIRYEWLSEEEWSRTGVSYTRPVDDGILITTGELIEEHELAHAAHLTAWPMSADFLQEGLAVLLDGQRIYGQGEWPDSLVLDEVLGAKLGPGEHYTESWLLVSQIVSVHGVDGLRELWHAVPPGASAARVRTEYEALFGEPIDALLEPEPERPNEDPSPKYPCRFALCPGDPEPFVPPRWALPGPSGCEDDPRAIGPHSRVPGLDGPPVWRQTIMTADQATFPEASDTLTTIIRPCFLQCWRAGNRVAFISPQTDWRFGEEAGRYRIETHTDLESLPTDDPGTVVIWDEHQD